MASWNRIDHDQIEREGRWQIALISNDPIRGVPPSLLGLLATALILLAVWR